VERRCPILLLNKTLAVFNVNRSLSHRLPVLLRSPTLLAGHFICSKTIEICGDIIICIFIDIHLYPLGFFFVFDSRNH